MSPNQTEVKLVSDCCFAPILDEEHGGPELCSKCRDHCGVHWEPETLKTAHTPGPWTWFPADPASESGGDYPPAVVGKLESAADFLSIAIMCEGTTISPDEAEANAHLIAAAPDLLEAAQAAIEILDGFWRCPYCGHAEDTAIRPMPHTNTCYFPGLIAAIAKATGAQS